MGQTGLLSSRVACLTGDPNIRAGDCCMKRRGRSTGANSYLLLNFLKCADLIFFFLNHGELCGGTCYYYGKCLLISPDYLDSVLFCVASYLVPSQTLRKKNILHSGSHIDEKEL